MAASRTSLAPLPPYRVTHERNTRSVNDYRRLAVYGLSFNYVFDLRLPLRHLDMVLEAVRIAFPSTQHWLLEAYSDHGRVLLWRMPEVKGMP